MSRLSRHRCLTAYAISSAVDFLPMKQFDFDAVVERRNSNSYKWDSAADPDVLPMWVADMDFKTAPAVIEALQKRVEHGIFGYSLVPDSYYEALTNWFESRHGYKFTRDEVIYTSGVVPAISAVIKALTKPGDKVLVQTPVYNCFFSSIRNNDCEIADSPLVYHNGAYTVDFDDLERKAADPAVKLMLLCNPHNPAGRVWTSAELRRIADICLRNKLLIVSDDIHCELVFPGYKYTPIATLSSEIRRNTITCCSPSKAFNIAGLQIANIIVEDPDLRKRIDKAININEVCDVNVFGIEALVAAYNNGTEWLNELTEYLHENYKVFCRYFAENLPQFTVTQLEATYLVWVDCRCLNIGSHALEEALVATARLWLNSGTMYGSDGFMRFNIACPRSVMLEGLRRFTEFVKHML